jgi:hypothetical protein
VRGEAVRRVCIASRLCARVSETTVRSRMSFSQFYRSVFTRLENLEFPQLALLTLVIVAFGFYCLRGFGSRHDY